MNGSYLLRRRRCVRFCALLLACIAVLMFPLRLVADSPPGLGELRQRDQVVHQVASRGRTSRALVMTATAYTNSKADTGKRPGDPDYGITFTGTRAKVGTVAVDPKVIPLGTRLYVEGYGPAVAEDIGGAVKGDMVDCFFETEAERDQWGRRQVVVRVIP